MKEKFYIASIAILLVVLGVWVKFSDDRLKDVQFERDFYVTESDSFKTVSGHRGSRIATLEGDVDNIRAVYEDSLKKLEKELGLKDKRIHELINATSETQVIFDLKPDSTGKAIEITPWSQIEINCSKGSVTGKFTVYDSLTFVRYKRGKWFQRKTLVMDGISWNPSTTVTGIRDITIREDPNKFALVVGPGVTFFDGKIRPVVTLTFGWKILQR